MLILQRMLVNFFILFVCCLYLQKMTALQRDHPHVHKYLMDELHVMRRSDRYWASLSSDLVIEQEVLMRSLKTTGGLTRGRGIIEKERGARFWARSMVEQCHRAFIVKHNALVNVPNIYLCPWIEAGYFPGFWAKDNWFLRMVIMIKNWYLPGRIP